MEGGEGPKATPTLIDLDKLDREEAEAMVKDVGEILGRKMKDNNGIFSEILPIKPGGELETVDSNQNVKSLFAVNAGNAEGLFKLAFRVQEKFPNLSFGFDRDPNGQWIKYSVSETPQAPQEQTSK